VLRGGGRGEASPEVGSSPATTTFTTVAAAISSTTCSPVPIDDGHGSGWAPIALTASGGWAGAAQQAGAVLKPKNAVRSHTSSSADTRSEAAATDVAAAHAAATVTATTEALPGPPVVDPVAIMQEVLDEHKRKSKGRHVLSEKDISGLLSTTALKTLAVLLAPPPQSCSCAQQPCALQQQQQPCGVVAIVVHAKEPKSTAATRCLSAFFARLVAAVKAATSALKKAHGGPENVYDDMSSAGANNSSAGSNCNNSSRCSSNDTTATTSNTTPVKCPAWVAARVRGAEWSNVTVLSDTNIAKAALSYG